MLVSDLKLPAGTTTDVDPDTLVVNITQQISQEALDAEIAESEEETGAGASEDESAEGDAAADAEKQNGEDA